MDPQKLGACSDLPGFLDTSAGSTTEKENSYDHPATLNQFSYFDKSLYSTLCYIKQRRPSSQIRSLVHGRRSIHQEYYNCHYDWRWVQNISIIAKEIESLSFIADGLQRWRTFVYNSICAPSRLVESLYLLLLPAWLTSGSEQRHKLLNLSSNIRYCFLRLQRRRLFASKYTAARRATSSMWSNSAPP